jgi:hypothetical protein
MLNDRVILTVHRPMVFQEYKARSSYSQEIDCHLGITTVAHMYEASTLATWAFTFVLRNLQHVTDNCNLLIRAYKLAKRVGDLQCGVDAVGAVCDAWRICTKRSDDPVKWLAAAKEMGDVDLQACAYLQIVSKTEGIINPDKRLGALDVLRLHIGIVNLRRWDTKLTCPLSTVITTRFQDVPLRGVLDTANEPFGSYTLSDLFTRSPAGISLAGDSLDAVKMET